MRKYLSGSLVLAMLSSLTVHAGEVEIIDVEFSKARNVWDVRTMVRHGDTGWDHFADAWRIVTEDGTVLGTRILQHPHVDEQPFARSLRGVPIPRNVRVVYVEARDNVHGWSRDRVRVDLSRSRGPRFRVKQ